MAAAMKSINVNKEVVFRFPGDKERRKGVGKLSQQSPTLPSDLEGGVTVCLARCPNSEVPSLFSFSY